MGLELEAFGKQGILRSFWSQYGTEQPRALSCPHRSLDMSETGSDRDIPRKIAGSWFVVEVAMIEAAPLIAGLKSMVESSRPEVGGDLTGLDVTARAI
jgi:hypothetical protein